MSELKSSKTCDKCLKHSGWCTCDLTTYTKIGDVSACQFLDNHTTSNGSVFFQGWAYKHNQMKFKMGELDIKLQASRELIDILLVTMEDMRQLPYNQDKIDELLTRIRE